MIKTEYKHEIGLFIKSKQEYKDNLTKAYALLWSQCSKRMQIKIEARTDYTSIKGNPILLLKAIKEHALNYQENRYSVAIVYESIKNMLATKKREGESLQDYTRRFKTALDVMEGHLGGAIALPKYAKSMPKYTKDTKDECLKEAADQFVAYMYLDNVDKTKYKTLLANLHSQQSLGNDQYPKELVKATNVLSTHRIDQAPKAKYQGQKEASKDKPKDAKDQNDEVVEQSFAQMEGKCYCCGKPGHLSNKCRLKDKMPKD